MAFEFQPSVEALRSSRQVLGLQADFGQQKTGRKAADVQKYVQLHLPMFLIGSGKTCVSIPSGYD